MDTNIGLHDTRMAMDWIGKHISKFGADTKKMTAIGLSAGAGVIMHAIVSHGGKGPKLPFQQVCSSLISLAGCLLTICRRSFSHQDGYRKPIRLAVFRYGKPSRQTLDVPMLRAFVRCRRWWCKLRMR